MIWLFGIASVILISLISLVGLITLPVSEKNLKRILTYLVSFSIGGLLGDAFFHLLPESMELSSAADVSILILAGIMVSFIVEKFVQWRHCHIPTSKDHPHPFAIMNLVGDAVHNFIDGLIIGASYLYSFNIGFATTMAVALHEIPQEIGDFGVLLHGGFDRRRALFLNFLTSLFAIIGTVASLLLGTYSQVLNNMILPFAIGSFIYIASSDLIPELHKETEPLKSLIQLVMIFLGLLIMYLFLFLE